MKAWHITHWDSQYENADLRKTVTMAWYKKSTKLIGEGIGATLRHEKNVALLGAWTLIETLAAGSGPAERGWLIRNGRPLTAARMEALLGVKAECFEEALAWFGRPEIGWLEMAELPGERPGKNPASGLSGSSPGERPGKNPASGLSGSSPGERPGNLPVNGENGETPGDHLARERERENLERENKEERERGDGRDSLSSPAGGPSVSEVEAWARESEIDPEFALEKLREAAGRGDFEKAGVRRNWRARFADFWKKDGRAWKKKNIKIARGAAGSGGDGAGHPDAWREGDADWWWTDSVAEVKAALGGACQKGDTRTADRLREILAARQK